MSHLLQQPSPRTSPNHSVREPGSPARPKTASSAPSSRNEAQPDRNRSASYELPNLSLPSMSRF